jgi:hypothetical protein
MQFASQPFGVLANDRIQVFVSIGIGHLLSYLRNVFTDFGVYCLFFVTIAQTDRVAQGFSTCSGQAQRIHQWPKLEHADLHLASFVDSTSHIGFYYVTQRYDQAPCSTDLLFVEHGAMFNKINFS